MELHSFSTQSLQIPPKNPNTNSPILHPNPEFLTSPAARQPFDKIPPNPNTFIWNNLLQSHIAAGDPHLAILAYRDMLQSGLLPDRHSLPRAIAAARLSSAFFAGRQLHSHAVKLRLIGDSYVLSALMELYSQFAGADSAFSLLSHYNPQSPIVHTVLARLYLIENNPDASLRVLYKLADSGIDLDAVAVATAAKACGMMKSVRDGKKIYDLVKERKLDRDILVANSLLKMYIECGGIDETLALFHSMLHKDAVSWTTIINSNVRNGLFNEGLKLFREMMAAGIKPDGFSVSAVLPACARMAARKHGMEIHGFIVRQHIETNISVLNALTDMYVKSGSIEIALKVFEKMPERDFVSWTVMILGYSLYGRGDLGVALFYEIISESNERIEPDEGTFAAALHACGTDCIIDQGKKIFEMIRSHHLKPEHCILMGRILARSGRFVEARALLKEHGVDRDLDALRTILHGCRIHSNRMIGRQVAEQLIELDPLNAENYVLLSNMFAANCRKAKELRGMMADMGLRAKKACSWIEFRCKIHAFGTGDVSHPRSERIYSELRRLMERMKEEGFESMEDFGFHDVDEERECIPYGHSEMLAIGFGLISTAASSVVRVTKNMRVCRNCHESAKLISRISAREILLRDPDRFHCFVNGSCSCKDIW